MSEVNFRASGFGALMTDGRGTVLTDKQRERIAELEQKQNLGKSLTDLQEKELETLIAKRDAPPELSDTAKRFVEKTWLLNERGYYSDLDNKYVGKGLFGEQWGLELISDLDDEFYAKNDERITKGNITGEADVVCEINGKRIIKDIKCSWSPVTFMAAEMTSLYEWQGRVYMHLYNADEFHLEYTLVDAPPHIYEQEVWRLKNRYGIIDIESDEARPLFMQLERNLIYSTNPAYTKEERRKTFKITRDLEIEKAMLEKLPLALKYYNSIKLNQTK